MLDSYRGLSPPLKRLELFGVTIMRKSLLKSLLLVSGACLGLMTFAANAVPIHVGLKDAAGSHSWDSPEIGDPHGILNLTAWEFDSGVWTKAVMTYKASTPAETGLGVRCIQHPTGNACSEKEIGTSPWQMIDLKIKKLTGWSSLTVNLASVNSDSGGDETGYLIGATCTVGGRCTSAVLANPNVLASCTDFGDQGKQTCSFNLTWKDLLGITDIWVTPSLTDQSGSNDGNILLGADFVLNTVPEPEALGMFGLGLLLIGLLVVVRRRRLR